MRFWNRSLMARLVTYFLTLSVIGVVVTTVITLTIVRNALTRSIYDRLEAVATLKEDEMNRWVNDQRDELTYMALDPELRANVRTLSNTVEGSVAYNNALDRIRATLAEEAASHASFSEIFLMSSVGGKVLASTNQANEGQYRVSDTYYTQGRLDIYVQNIYTSPQTGQPTMTIAAPVRDDGGNLLGVIALHVNLERLDSIILQRAGLGNTGETYLVDRFNNFISAARSGKREFPRGVHTQGIDAALQGENGLALYDNYNGIPVIGVYRWLDERDAALLAEISQAEALAPVQGVAVLILASGLIIAAILALVAFLLSRQIARPLLAISDAANRMAEGNLDVHAPEMTQDEIGVLAHVFNTMTAYIRELIQGLEQRVAERTAELEKANLQNQRRAARFESITRVSRAITSAQNIQELLPHISEVISAEFGFYHIGIFLNDDAGQYAVLVASNSPGGKQMLERSHKLKIGEQGIVGYVTGSGAPRIALDVGADAVYFDNPDLPATRSEMALPLKVAEKIIGALDVQSTEPSAFSNEDITSLSILADQVSIAIENARLYEATQKSLEQAETAYRRFVQGEWQRLMQEEEVIGVRFASGTTAQLTRPLDIGEGAHVLEDGRLYQQDGSLNRGVAELTVPVKLRGEVIGVLNLSMPGRDQWLDDEIDIAEAVAERLALSVENARLFQTATTRAERERVISEISSKIGGSIHMENLLKVAAQEISQALNGSEVLIQIQSAKPAGGQE